MIATVLLGGITHHYLGSSLPYCNKINNVGTIVNPYIAAMAGNRKRKVGFIFGTDSACGNIIGPVSSFAIYKNVDFILGAYNTNFKKFNELQIKPPTVLGITPIVGMNYKIKLSKNIDLNNIVSVGILSHAISMDF
jgi:hypothetical protein